MAFFLGRGSKKLRRWLYLDDKMDFLKKSCESRKSTHWIISYIFSLQLIASYHPGKSQYSTALRVANQPKNRSPDLLSTDSARVFLNPGGEMDGDDYINASWLMGK